MGRKIICESCGTVFKEELLGNQEICPVCGKSLVDDNIEETELSFGDGVELGENDSFDEDKIDFWWSSVREPKTLDDSDTGDIDTVCVKCGYPSGGMPYPIAKSEVYLLVDKRYNHKCGHCGNEMKNHILSKRPANYVDPRQREIWVKDWDNIPRCPICSSTQIHKISATNKVASALTFGIFAAGHVSKTYKCDTCGAKF